ncbi:hypothetical protein EYC80_007710 [Monilinia laxa]|uniref:Uncharacterized protein n=1 Tax=Monilinia laxa TaxID=61186 RepID=A0A5N6JX59_MONLA|nr:hypothetical protein EYC80_007710 [Monilinia laxa]
MDTLAPIPTSEDSFIDIMSQNLIDSNAGRQKVYLFLSSLFHLPAQPINNQTRNHEFQSNIQFPGLIISRHQYPYIRYLCNAIFDMNSKLIKRKKNPTSDKFFAQKFKRNMPPSCPFMQ